MTPDDLAFGKGAGNSNQFRLLGAGGASLLGTLTAEHIGIDGYLYHNGDTNTRIRFLGHNNELRFIDVRSFGQMWWIKEGLLPTNLIKGLGNLGPEPFSEDFNINYEVKLMIKNLLNDQHVVSFKNN